MEINIEGIMKTNIIRFILISIISIVSTTVPAQNKTMENFDKRVKLALLLIEKQPGYKNIKSVFPKGFTLDSTTVSGYYISSKDRIQMFSLLNNETKRIASVEFCENKIFLKEIQDYVEKELKYIPFGGSEDCYYYNKDNSSLRLCPTKEGIMVYIDKVKN